jgi:hypothetical protein
MARRADWGSPFFLRGAKMTKRKRLALILGVFACVFALSAGFAYALLVETDPREYRAIRCGMGREEVVAIFHREPDRAAFGLAVWHMTDISAIEVDFDTKGRVIGKVWKDARVTFLDKLGLFFGQGFEMHGSEVRCD